MLACQRLQFCSFAPFAPVKTNPSGSPVPTAANNSHACRDSGTVNALAFLRLAPGMIHCAASRSISHHREPHTSSSRAAVSSKNRAARSCPTHPKDTRTARSSSRLNYPVPPRDCASSRPGQLRCHLVPHRAERPSEGSGAHSAPPCPPNRRCCICRLQDEIRLPSTAEPACQEAGRRQHALGRVPLTRIAVARPAHARRHRSVPRACQHLRAHPSPSCELPCELPRYSPSRFCALITSAARRASASPSPTPTSKRRRPS